MNMKDKLVLSQEILKALLHYDPETGILKWAKNVGFKIKSGSIAGYKDKDGYISLKINGKEYKAHRLAWLYMTGQMPKNMIDHKNTIKTDNWFDNLREATNGQNQQNQIKPKSHNTTGFLGVSLDKTGGKYRAQIAVDGKQKRLGYFTDPKEASKAYLEAKQKYHAYSTI